MRASLALSVLALAAVAAAWGLHDFAQIGACGGDDGAPPCPPEFLSAFLALFVAIGGTVFAVFLHPSGRLFTAAFGLLLSGAGLGIGWSQLGPSAEEGVDPSGPWLAVSGISLLIGVLILGVALKTTPPSAPTQGAWDVGVGGVGDGGDFDGGCGGGGCGGGGD